MKNLSLRYRNCIKSKLENQIKTGALCVMSIEMYQVFQMIIK